MANPEHVKIVRQGAAAIAEWRRQNPGVPFDLTRADLADADLSGAELAPANLEGANLTRANLSGAHLRGTNLVQAHLRTADLGGADLHRAILAGANLPQANLSAANLFAATLRGANLAGANLAQANLRRANLRRANLTGANISGANLMGAHLTTANLTGANLASAGLTGVNLAEADLTETNLAEAYFGRTSLGNCDLSQATGLSTVNHLGPSSVGVDPLILSFRGAGNKLTPDLEAFFLGAGVPKELLTALPRIVGEVEYYSCFVSYGQPDLGFAKKLRDDLAARGVACWLYDLDATPGERTRKEIGEARRQADKMVVICSAAALIRDGVLNEIEDQIDEDPDKMVPIARDDIWIQSGFRVVRGSRDLGPFLRDRNYADFSDESRYEESLRRLLKALRRKAE
jgi:uncharacterized protein YjbI with pentapeptide repeats